MRRRVADLDRRLSVGQIRRAAIQWFNVEDEGLYSGDWGNVPNRRELEFALDATGRVVFRGSCENLAGTAGESTILTLPAGYRPSAVAYVLVTYEDQTTNPDFQFPLPVRVNTTGTIVSLYAVSSTDSYWFDGARFTP